MRSRRGRIVPRTEPLPLASGVWAAITRVRRVRPKRAPSRTSKTGPSPSSGLPSGSLGNQFRSESGRCSMASRRSPAIVARRSPARPTTHRRSAGSVFDCFKRPSPALGGAG
jgi:hypothetical protein